MSEHTLHYTEMGGGSTILGPCRNCGLPVTADGFTRTTFHRTGEPTQVWFTHRVCPVPASLAAFRRGAWSRYEGPMRLNVHSLTPAPVYRRDLGRGHVFDTPNRRHGPANRREALRYVYSDDARSNHHVNGFFRAGRRANDPVVGSFPRVMAEGPSPHRKPRSRAHVQRAATDRRCAVRDSGYGRRYNDEFKYQVRTPTAADRFAAQLRLRVERMTGEEIEGLGRELAAEWGDIWLSKSVAMQRRGMLLSALLREPKEPS